MFTNNDDDDDNENKKLLRENVRKTCDKKFQNIILKTCIKFLIKKKKKYF